jgi:hypothetical protein
MKVRKDRGLDSELEQEVYEPLPEYSKKITNTFDYLGIGLFLSSAAYLVYRSGMIPETKNNFIKLATDLYNTFSYFLS